MMRQMWTLCTCYRLALISPSVVPFQTHPLTPTSPLLSISVASVRRRAHRSSAHSIRISLPRLQHIICSAAHGHQQPLSPRVMRFRSCVATLCPANDHCYDCRDVCLHHFTISIFFYTVLDCTTFILAPFAADTRSLSKKKLMTRAHFANS